MKFSKKKAARYKVVDLGKDHHAGDAYCHHQVIVVPTVVSPMTPLFPNSLSAGKIPKDLHKIMEVGVSWELDDVFQG